MGRWGGRGMGEHGAGDKDKAREVSDSTSPAGAELADCVARTHPGKRSCRRKALFYKGSPAACQPPQLRREQC